jgi:hypothetical protein
LDDWFHTASTYSERCFRHRSHLRCHRTSSSRLLSHWTMQ